jgi:transposase-like protein
MARSTLLPHRKVVQARALLMAADGMANQQIARRCEVDSDTVRRWRDRFVHGGPGGVGVIARGVVASRRCRRARWLRCCG